MVCSAGLRWVNREKMRIHPASHGHRRMIDPERKVERTILAKDSESAELFQPSDVSIMQAKIMMREEECRDRWSRQSLLGKMEIGKNLMG